LNFNAASDVAANGTVEKFELHPFDRRLTGWKVMTWSAKGHVMGTGNVAFQFLPGVTLADSTLKYKASCKMSIPDNLAVDWSGVSGDVLGNAERTVVQQVIKNAAYFTAEKGIPIESVGEVKPFKATVRSKRITVRSFSITSGQEGVVITLNARAKI
jgi:hypothetical protein